MQGLCHLNIAEAFIAEGRWDEADEPCERALAIALQRGDSLRRADALKFLGILERERGRIDRADRHHRHALDLAREGQDSLLEAEILRELGSSRWRRAEEGPARELWQESIDLFRSIDASLDAAAVEKLLQSLPASTQPSARREGATR